MSFDGFNAESVFDSSDAQKFTLEKEEELRIELDGTEKFHVKLLTGTAELFGTELLLEKEYVFSLPARFAIFTWHGCEIVVYGKTKMIYKKNDTPMVSYINTHAALETLRDQAQADKSGKTLGPRCLIVGPMDSGKSTLSRILLSYAARVGHKPIFCDLDVGQNSISIPGVVAATSVEQPIAIESAAQDAFSLKAPLCYFYGHASPSISKELYMRSVDRLAETVEKRCMEYRHVSNSGIIINTCGWIDQGGLGMELLLHAVEKFHVNIILVLEKDDLYNMIKQESKIKEKSVYVAQLSKSGGVGTRDPDSRKQARNRCIHDYFYGSNSEFQPHTRSLQFKDADIYKTATMHRAPSTALPIGQQAKQDPTRLGKVLMSSDLVNNICAISFAKEPGQLLDTNVMGFVHITGVDVTKKTLTILSPAAGELPNKLLLAGSIKWQDGV